MLRASSAESACEMAQTTPISSAVMASTPATLAAVSPPLIIAQPTNGSVSASATRPTLQLAASLPSVICAGDSRVIWSVARVPRSRSPLIDWAVRAGLITSTTPSTKNIRMPNIGTPMAPRVPVTPSA